ncbi:hypothetical protein CY35_05G020000 [Sphagnum magellanicum]|nr:hypothetical protein CY35_05G020000 [Sphagnum magellanicum]
MWKSQQRERGPLITWVRSPNLAPPREIACSMCCWKEELRISNFQWVFRACRRTISFSGNRANISFNSISGSLPQTRASINVRLSSCLHPAAGVLVECGQLCVFLASQEL